MTKVCTPVCARVSVHVSLSRVGEKTYSDKSFNRDLTISRLSLESVLKSMQSRELGDSITIPYRSWFANIIVPSL